MARFYYTTVIDEKKVSDTEINAKFANLTTAINTTKFSNEQFEISSIWNRFNVSGNKRKFEWWANRVYLL